MRKALFLILLFFWQSIASGLQDMQDPLRLEIDFARFRGVNTYLYVEIYYSFPEKSLTYIQSDERWLGELDLQIVVMELKEGYAVKEKNISINHTIEDPEIERAQSLIGVSGIFLEPEAYQIEITGTDRNDPQRQETVTFSVTFPPIPDEHVAVSDIQFANSIRQIPEDQGNIFYKNTLEVIPNPGRIYGVGYPILFYYLETYNLLPVITGGSYTVKVIVNDAIGNQYYEHERAKRRIHESSVEVGTINTNQFPTGSYTLIVSVIDSLTNVVANSSGRFFVYNPQYSIDEHDIDGVPAGVVASDFAFMSEEELKTEFERMRYIVSQSDRQVFSRLESMNQKRQFLYEYWRQLDPDPTDRDNPIRREYLNRVEYANKQFGFGFKEGWKTDMGRVYIMYGPPDEYERHPSRSDTKPYEIWFYHRLQGGVMFVFVDRTGFQDYQLVHSTHRNELRDDNWRQYIRAME